MYYKHIAKKNHETVYEWVSEQKDPKQSNPYPERLDVVFTTENPAQQEIDRYLRSVNRQIERQNRDQAKQALELLLLEKQTLSSEDTLKALQLLFQLVN